MFFVILATEKRRKPEQDEVNHERLRYGFEMGRMKARSDSRRLTPWRHKPVQTGLEPGPVMRGMNEIDYYLIQKAWERK